MAEKNDIPSQDEFFDEPEPSYSAPQNRPSSDGQDGGRYAPNLEKRNKNARIKQIITAIVTAIVLFVGGIFTGRLFLDEELRVLMKIKDGLQDSYYEEITDEAFYGVIFDAVNGMLDDYSGYMTEEEYAQALSRREGNQSGVGIVFTDATGLLVQRSCGNSPAERAGLTGGDLLVGIGATETELVPIQTRAELDEQLSAYAQDAPFYLQWRKTDGNTQIGEVCRTNYVENYVYYRTNTQSNGFTGTQTPTATQVGTPLTSLSDETAYIKITSFNGAAAQAFDSAMSLFQSDGKRDLVLDLRGNGGGYMHILQEIAKYFCKSSESDNPVVAVADYGEERANFLATDNLYAEYFSAESRIKVLADAYSASATECLLGCMLDYDVIDYDDICLTLDEGGVAKTYGKGIMQTTYPFLGGKQGALKLTTARILWPQGHCLHGRGITGEDGTKTVAYTVDDAAWLEQAFQVLQAE